MRLIILLISLKTGKNLTPREPETVLHNGLTLPIPLNMDLHSNKIHLLWEPRWTTEQFWKIKLLTVMMVCSKSMSISNPKEMSPSYLDTMMIKTFIPSNLTLQD